MRIGMLADVYKPHVSGVTHFISLNKRAMEAAGHKVFVFTFGDLDYEDDELNVIRSPGLPMADTGYYLGLRYSSQARRKVRTMDVVHVHHPFLSGRLALRYCRPYGIPIIFTNHTRYDLYARTYLPLVPEAISTALLQSYMPSFCRDVDLVIAPSMGVRRVLEGLGVDVEIRVIPNGVDLAPFLKPVEPVARSQLGVDPQDTLLVYVGRVAPEKNLHFLLRAFFGAHGAYPKSGLLIVGDGPELEHLKDFVARSGMDRAVRFTGLVDYGQLPRYLAAADAFVTASVTEVHPLSVIEALAAGLPVLGVESPGVGDTITDGENGLLAAHDLAAFTAKMVRLITDADLRQRLAAKARPSARRYDIQHTSAQLLALYEELIAKHQTRRGGILPRWVYRLRDRLG